MRILMLVFFLSAAESICIAQGWKDIQPLRSTCDDVKKALKVDKCEYPDSIYRLSDETVTVRFVTCPCPISCDSAYGGWNVPFGTVAGIIRELHKPFSVTTFDINDRKWTKLSTDMIGEVLYDDNEAGISLSTIDGNVSKITYYPPLEKNKNLLCPRCSTPTPIASNNKSASSWLHGYGDLSFEDEKKHLDKLAIKLQENSSDSIGYIVAYGGCRSTSEQVQQRLQRAKEYLVTTYGIPSSRIAIVDGGRHESFEIELHIRARGLPPPRTASSIYPANLK